MCAVWLVLLQHKVNPRLELVSWVASFPSSEELEKEAIVCITTSLQAPHFLGRSQNKAN